jgi:SET domain-containing protein
MGDSSPRAAIVEPSAPPGLCVRSSPGRGRGVFALRAFAPGDVVERAPVVVFPRVLVSGLGGTVLDDYWFWWDDACNALALGCGSLYNHACPANARFERDFAGRLLVFVAVRAIAPGDEVTINYGGDPDEPAPVWFEST